MLSEPAAAGAAGPELAPGAAEAPASPWPGAVDEAPPTFCPEPAVAALPPHAANTRSAAATPMDALRVIERIACVVPPGIVAFAGIPAGFDNGPARSQLDRRGSRSGASAH